MEFWQNLQQTELMKKWQSTTQNLTCWSRDTFPAKEARFISWKVGRRSADKDDARRGWWLVFQTRAADNGSVSLLNDKPASSAPKNLSCESQMNGFQWMLLAVTMGELVTVCIPILKTKVKPSDDPRRTLVSVNKETFSSILCEILPQELFQPQCAIRNRHHVVFTFSPNP